jgi:general secretion pathway protein A
MLRYYQHFGLQRDPFLDTADPQFYCELPSVRRNAQAVLAGIAESRGLTVVIGAPGTGKTSLSAFVEGSLLRDEGVVIGKILDPTFATDVEFLLAIGRVFGLGLPPRSSAALKNAIKNFFFDTAVLEEKNLVLLIDEAQNLTDEGLETLRLLLNFQIPQRKLLNLVLFGQSELEGRILGRTNFADRVDRYIRLERLDRGGAAAMIEHRLVKAGKSPAARVFTTDAFDTIVAAGDGLPRRLANIVRGAMGEAADRSAEVVNVDHVAAALRARGIPVPAAAAPAPVVAAAPATAYAAPNGAADVLERPALIDTDPLSTRPSLLARLFTRRA